MVKSLRASIIGAALLAALGLGSSHAFSAERAASDKKSAPTPLQLVQTANTLFAQGDYESARKYYLEVLPSFPKNFDILRNLAYCYFVMGPRGYGGAANYYAQAHSLNPQSSEVTSQLVKCLRGLNRNAEAAIILRSVAEAPGAPAEAWKNLAQAYDAADMLPDAVAAYDAYLERNPSDLDARTSLGNVYGRHQDYGPALEQFRIVLSANPNFSPALLGMAKILSWRNQFDESLQLYDRLLRLSPENGEAATGKAFALLWMSRSEEAQSIFEKLHRRFPRDPDVARGLDSANASLAEKQMSAARHSGNVTQVEALYRERLTKNPRDLEALRTLATMTATPQRCAESIDFSRRATELSPDNSSLALLLANGLALCQQYSESVARYQQYLESNPKAEGAMYDLGAALARARRPAEAIEVFRKLLEINPNNRDGAQGLAQALAATGSYQEALLRYDQVLKASPNNYDALQGKAFVLFWTEHFAEAHAIFQTLAAERPSDAQNPQALQDIARAQEAARWVALRPAPNAPPEDLLRYYEKRLASYPDDANALKAVAYLQAELKNTPGAIEGYRRFLEKYPDDRDAKMELARLLATADKYDESIELYQDVLKANPDDPAALDSLARAYVWANQPDQALPIYKRLLDKNPANTGYQMQAARLELAMKDYPAARGQLASLVSTDPQNREARLTLARLDQTLGQTDDSLKNYDELLKQNPRDADALLGKAQISYYRGDMPEAETSASAAAMERPKNFDTLILMANIEHARGHRRKSRAWLDHADRVTPGNPEATELRNRLHDESAVTMHTSATYGHEITAPGQEILPAITFQQPTLNLRPPPLVTFSPVTFPGGVTNDAFGEDATFEGYGTTIAAHFFPHVDSYLSFSSLPTQSRNPSLCSFESLVPENNAPTVSAHCAIAPWSFVSWHSWHVSSVLTIRGGAGLARYGPANVAQASELKGNLANLVNRFGTSVLSVGIPAPQTSQKSSGSNIRPTGLAGATITPSKKFSIDLDWSHSPALYFPTPVAMNEHLSQTRYEGWLHFFFTPRTRLDVDFFHLNLYVGAPVTSYDFAYTDTSELQNVSLSKVTLMDPITQQPITFTGLTFDKLPSALLFLNPTQDCPVITLSDHVTQLQPRTISQNSTYVLCAFGNPTSATSLRTDWGNGGAIKFNQNLVRGARFSLDGGYNGTLYGYAASRENFRFGFFHPSFYQNQMLTGRIYGKLFGPVGYDLSGGLGVQQVHHGTALTRSSIVTPAVSFKASPNLTLGFSYTRYNTAQVLGPLRGKAFALTTDWKF